MSEEKDDVVVQEEVWGDGELGLVLKEAAANWEAEEGYKEEVGFKDPDLALCTPAAHPPLPPPPLHPSPPSWLLG